MRRLHVACIAAVALGRLSSADAPPAERTPAEWLAEVQRRTRAERQAEASEWTRLLTSAGRCMHPYFPLKPRMLRQADAAQRKKHDPYGSWLAETGWPAYEAWTGAPGKLAPPAGKHRWLLHAMACLDYRSLRRRARSKQPLDEAERRIAEYGRRVEHRGQDVLRKGYRGAKLTAGQVEDLRRFAVWIDIRCTGAGILPYHLGLTAPARSRRPQVGKPAIDFALPTMQACLGDADTSDLNPADTSDLFRPIVLTEYLLLMDGYEPEPNAPGMVRPRAGRFGPDKAARLVRLSSFAGKKAVLFVLANATDVWAWHWKMAPMFEPLRQAYRDRVEMLFVHTTIHDTHMPVKDFFGPSPGRHDAVRERSLAHRARFCKMLYMDYPHFTTPYLLDDMAQTTRNAYRDQGGGAYVVLVGLDGIVAYADYHQDIPPHWGPKAVQFPYEFTNIRMNHLERRLAAFAANGCRYDKSIVKPHPVWRLEAGPGAAERLAAVKAMWSRPSIWLAGRVASADAAKRRLTVERIAVKPEEMIGWQLWQQTGAKARAFDDHTRGRLAVVGRWVREPEKTRRYEFTLGAGTDVFLNGRSSSPAELAAGDFVGVRYATADDRKPVIAADLVRATRRAD